MKKNNNLGILLGYIATGLLVLGLLWSALVAQEAVKQSTEVSLEGYVELIVVVNLCAMVPALIGSILAMSKKRAAGVLFIVAASLAFIALLLIVFTSIFHWGAVPLLIIASVHSLKNAPPKIEYESSDYHSDEF